MKLTARQAEVMANLQMITTDGSRHEPQFRLGEKNVSVQVRSLLMYGLIELRDGLPSTVGSAPIPKAAVVKSGEAVSLMRGLLDGDTKS